MVEKSSPRGESGGFVQQPCSNAIFSLRKCGLHRPHGLISHTRQKVRVGVQGYGYGSVPQKHLDELGMGALRAQQGGTGVPEVVEADVRQPGPSPGPNLR